MSTTPMPRTDEALLVAALQRGDEWAFTELIDRYGAVMLRVARSYVRSTAVAEDVVQETWMAVIRGVARFEARSSVRTWLFRILTNRAKTRAEREGRCVPFSSLTGEDEDWEGAVPAERFLHPQHPGGWSAPPVDWRTIPDERLLGRETVELFREALAELPPRQQQVLALRDVEGWTAEEVCRALDVSEGNQRVLLHRARSKVRAFMEPHVDELVSSPVGAAA
jgi:RNA polymerase sigma-70 factor (ECF subfamily)